MPAYRVYDFDSGKVRRIPFVQLVTHEGHYPFRDAKMWRDEDRELPVSFLPTEEVCDSPEEFERYQFAEPEMTEISFTIPWCRSDATSGTPVLTHPSPSSTLSTPLVTVTPSVPRTVPASAPPPTPATTSVDKSSGSDENINEDPTRCWLTCSTIQTTRRSTTQLQAGKATPSQFGTTIHQAEEQVVIGEDMDQSAATCHQCTEGCADKYLSSILLYNSYSAR